MKELPKPVFQKVYSTADKQKEFTNCHLTANCRVARSFFILSCDW